MINVKAHRRGKSIIKAHRRAGALMAKLSTQIRVNNMNLKLAAKASGVSFTSAGNSRRSTLFKRLGIVERIFNETGRAYRQKKQQGMRRP